MDSTLWQWQSVLEHRRITVKVTDVTVPIFCHYKLFPDVFIVYFVPSLVFIFSRPCKAKTLTPWPPLYNHYTRGKMGSARSANDRHGELIIASTNKRERERGRQLGVQLNRGTPNLQPHLWFVSCAAAVVSSHSPALVSSFTVVFCEAYFFFPCRYEKENG